MLNFNLRTNYFIFLLSMSIVGCSNWETYAEEPVKNIKVIDCTIDFDDVNFCSSKNNQEYLKIIKEKKVNFDKNKNLFNFNYNGSNYLAIIDLKNSKVFTFPASIKSNKLDFLKFDSSSNVFCVVGDINQFQNSYRNVESCYVYKEGNFNLKSRKNLDSNVYKNEKIKFINLPNSSSLYSECRKKSNEKECTKLTELNDYSYSEDKVQGVLKSISFPDSAKLLNANTFRFISNKDTVKYAIAEKYVDNDETVSSEFFLIYIGGNSNGKVVKLGGDYSINKLGVIEYNGNKKINLF